MIAIEAIEPHGHQFAVNTATNSYSGSLDAPDSGFVAQRPDPESPSHRPVKMIIIDFDKTRNELVIDIIWVLDNETSKHITYIISV